MQITVISSRSPAVLSKHISRGADGTLTKSSSAHLSHGSAQVVNFSSASEFGRVLDGLAPNQAVAYGRPQANEARLMSANEKARTGDAEAITRSNAHFSWPSGGGVMMLDYDPSGNEQPLGRDALLNTLFCVSPALSSSAWVWRPSASGCIEDAVTGAPIEGIKGQRVYIFVKDANDIERAGKVLFKRLWLAGHGRIEFARNGHMLERTVVDATVWQPSRLDFAAGAVCGPGLRRNPPPTLAIEGGQLDSRAALQDLSPEEEARLRDMVNAAKAQNAPASSAMLEQYVVEVAQQRGVAPDDVRAQIHVASEHRALANDFVVTLAYGGGDVTVADILCDPEKYHGKVCLDPLEPEYNNHHPVGKIYNDSKGAFIDSKAHGGTVYVLGSLPALVWAERAADPDLFDNLLDDIRRNGCDEKHAIDLATRANDPVLNFDQAAICRAALMRELKAQGLLSKEMKALVEGAKAQAVEGAERQTVAQTVVPEGHFYPLGNVLPSSVWHPMHTKGKDNKPKGTAENFKVMMRAYGMSACFNEMSKELTLRVPGLNEGSTLRDEAALSRLVSVSNLNEYPKGDIDSMVVDVAHENSHDPVAEWVNSAPWDGQDHIGVLFNQVRLSPDEDPQQCFTLFRKWMLNAAATGMGHTHGCESVLVFVDEKGGAGKTRFFRSLCPPDLRKDSLTLDVNDKDSRFAAISTWLVELGELDGSFSRQESHLMKSFLSATIDEIRLPYGRKALKYPRRTAFLGTVNSVAFLVDDSDNRRFWPMQVEALNYMHDVNVQQAWAQAWHAVRSGEPLKLDHEDDQALRIRNRGHRAGSSIEDSLATFVLNNPSELEHSTVTALLKSCGVHNPRKSDLNEGSKWLRDNGFRYAVVSGTRGFYVPNPAAKLSATAFAPQLKEVK